MADDIRIIVDSSDVVTANKRLNQLDSTVAKTGKTSGVATKSFNGAIRGVNQFGEVARGGGKNLNTFNMQLQQGGYQLQDFIVQLQGGTSFFTAFSQQGSQFAGVFGPKGAVIGAVIALGSAIGGMAFAMIKASEDARTLEERVADTEKAISSLILATERVTMSTNELRDSFGSASESAKGTLDLLRQIAQVDAQRNIDAISQAMSEMYGVRGDGASGSAVANFFDLNIFLAVGKEQRKLRDEARRLTNVYVTQQEILANSNGNLDAQISATEKLIDSAQALAELKDGVSDSEREAIRELAENLSLMQKMQGAKDQSLITSDEIARADEAANAERLLGEQMLAVAREKALSQFNADLAATAATLDSVFKSRTLFYSIRFAGEETVMGQSLTPSPMKPKQSYEELLAMGVSPDALLGMGLKPKKARTSGGGGGADQRERKLQSFIESLQTERETLETWRTEQFDLLAQYNDTELEMIGGQAEAKLRIEQEYQDKRLALIGQSTNRERDMVFDSGIQILNAIGQFSDKALKIARVASAAKALINTYEGASEALKLPFPANLAAAASVISAGMGFVASIKSGSSSGSTSGSAATIPAATQAATPQRVIIEGVDRNSLITGEQLSNIFDALYKENEDRGLVFEVAR